jgi:4'-phosphopantetheinyl transferase
LDAGERDKARRFRRVDDCVAFLASHAALRVILATYTGTPAHEIAFDVADGQRPELAGAGVLRFNLTHTSGLFAVSITRRVACGVDAERLSSRALDDALLGAVLSASELAHISRLATHEADAAFHRAWTRKESVLKALGLGLKVDPRCVSVETADDAAYIDDPVVDPDLRAGWRVRTLWPTPEHVVSVAIRSPIDALELTLVELDASLDTARRRK